MDGLCNISGMKIVVIRYALQIVIFQGCKEIQQCRRNYLEHLEKISGLKKDMKNEDTYTTQLTTQQDKINAIDAIVPDIKKTKPRIHQF